MFYKGYEKSIDRKGNTNDYEENIQMLDSSQNKERQFKIMKLVVFLKLSLRKIIDNKCIV